MNPGLASKRIKVVSAIVIAGIIFSVYLIFDPASTWWMPQCPVYFLTGLQCPGCGSQRALHALFTGNLHEAFLHNALLLILIPYLLVLAIVEFNRNRWPKTYGKLTSLPAILAILILLVGWTIFRNIYL